MRKLTSLFVLLLTVLFATSAFAAAGDLLVYAPKSSKLVMGANLGALKPSPLYRDMMTFVRSRPAFNEFLTFLEQDGGLNVDRDIDSLMVAMPEVSMTPNQASGQDTLSLAVRGKFDRTKLIAALTKRSPDHKVEGEGPTARHLVGEFTLAFITDTDLVMTVGDPGFQAKTWTATQNKKESALSNKAISAMSPKVNLTRGMWLIGLTDGLPQNGAKMNVAGLTVDLVSGLKVDIVGTMNSKEDVKKSLEDFENLKKEASNPMVAMMGATPLVTNLKSSSKGLDIMVTTNMTATELQNMVTMLKSSLAAGSQPMAPNVPGDKQPTSTPAPTKGADADFN
ncbi:MAG: hypothetical protein R3E66_24945 [bacterium]